MKIGERWLLPEGIRELLPEQASRVERLRCLLLDQCRLWGYELVMPPLAEYTDALLAGLGADLELMTCKFPDLDTGKMLGVRADITPQVARIDAHSLARKEVTRLCYAGATLLSLPDSFSTNRSPLQLGAELFGSPAVDADEEIMSLLLTLFEKVSMRANLTIDLGHVAVGEAVLNHTGLPLDQRRSVISALQRKSRPDLEAICADLDDDTRETLLTLSRLHGGGDVISQARAAFSELPGVVSALDSLSGAIKNIERQFPGCSLYVDLTEHRGFRYHSGLVFAVYAEGYGSALAKGGRYDNVGVAFGRGRPATGFAIDLISWADLLPQEKVLDNTVLAPADESALLRSKINDLRADGVVVINALSDGEHPRCSHNLVFMDGEWVVEKRGDLNQ